MPFRIHMYIELDNFYIHEQGCAQNNDAEWFRLVINWFWSVSVPAVGNLNRCTYYFFFLKVKKITSILALSQLLHRLWRCKSLVASEPPLPNSLEPCWPLSLLRLKSSVLSDFFKVNWLPPNSLTQLCLLQSLLSLDLPPQVFSSSSTSLAISSACPTVLHSASGLPFLAN